MKINLPQENPWFNIPLIQWDGSIVKAEETICESCKRKLEKGEPILCMCVRPGRTTMVA